MTPEPVEGGEKHKDDCPSDHQLHHAVFHVFCERLQWKCGPPLGRAGEGGDQAARTRSDLRITWILMASTPLESAL